jgi:hypothetical protein
MVGGYEKASFSLFRRGIIHIQRKNQFIFPGELDIFKTLFCPLRLASLMGHLGKGV